MQSGFPRLQAREDVNEHEKTEDAPFSETLSGLENYIELELGYTPTEYEDGDLFVNVTYDRRPGGSL